MVPSNSQFLKWMGLITEAAKKMGRPFIPANTQSQRMIDCGFIHVTTHWKMWPFSPWHSDKRKIGGLCLLGMEEFLESYSFALLTRHMEMGIGEVQILCNNVMAEIYEGNCKYWDKAWFIYGQKPSE